MVFLLFLFIHPSLHTACIAPSFPLLLWAASLEKWWCNSCVSSRAAICHYDWQVLRWAKWATGKKRPPIGPVTSFIYCYTFLSSFFPMPQCIKEPNAHFLLLFFALSPPFLSKANIWKIYCDHKSVSTFPYCKWVYIGLKNCNCRPLPETWDVSWQVESPEQWKIGLKVHQSRQRRLVERPAFHYLLWDPDKIIDCEAVKMFVNQRLSRICSYCKWYIGITTVIGKENLFFYVFLFKWQADHMGCFILPDIPGLFEITYKQLLLFSQQQSSR